MHSICYHPNVGWAMQDPIYHNKKKFTQIDTFNLRYNLCKLFPFFHSSGHPKALTFQCYSAMGQYCPVKPEIKKAKGNG